MAAPKVRRVRIGTRISVELRNRLSKYCAASGLSERTVIEDALRKYLDATDDTTLLLRRFDRVDRALARERRDVELLSATFGQYMQSWFAAHVPSTSDAGMGATATPRRRSTRSSRSTSARSSRGVTALSMTSRLRRSVPKTTASSRSTEPRFAGQVRVNPSANCPNYAGADK